MATIALTVVYMLVGGLHLFCDKNVTIVPAAEAILAVSDVGDRDAAGKSAVAGHHCPCCFPVYLPAQPVVALPVEVASAVVTPPRVHRVDMTPKHDTPPPKFLS